MNTLAYLCSEYPALSHTFISREIDILEKEGFHILTASINPVKSPDKLGIHDRARAARTYYLKKTPYLKIILSVFRYFLNPGRFIAVLHYCLKLNTFAGPHSLTKSVGYFIQAILLHSWAKKEGISHIHIHFPNPAATVALLACKFKGLEFSLSVHGPDEFYNVDSYNLREKIRQAVFVRCIGYYCRSQLMLLTPEPLWKKFHIVRCGLYEREILSIPQKTGQLKNILCVGRLCPSKGQLVLLEAAGRLHSSGVDFKLLLLGGGEDLETLKQKVFESNLADCVTIAGAVSHDRVKDELSRTDIFVLPSFAEGIPVALMEAMAAGIPVISTNITGIPELIEHGKDGFLTQASNSEQLADTLSAILGGQVELKEIQNNAVKKIRTLYDVEKNTRELGAIFNAV